MKSVPKEVIRELIKQEQFVTTTDVMEAMKEMFSQVLGEVLEAELDTQLGYEKSTRRADTETPKNYRNGHTQKTVKTQLGEVEITVPRDRNGAVNAVALAFQHIAMENFLIPFCNRQ